MKKTPTMFRRDPDNMKNILPEPHPDCAWVFAGEGVATRKYDGTCCLIQNGRLYKRREIRLGATPPEGFMQADADTTTHKCIGWVPVSFTAPEDAHHADAFHRYSPLEDGTYELLGPKVQGNPEAFPCNTLLAHRNAETYPDAPRDFHGLKAWLAERHIEGLVFHHPDGRMAKIKKRDFGLDRAPQA